MAVVGTAVGEGESKGAAWAKGGVPGMLGAWVEGGEVVFMGVVGLCVGRFSVLTLKGKSALLMRWMMEPHAGMFGCKIVARLPIPTTCIVAKSQVSDTSSSFAISSRLHHYMCCRLIICHADIMLERLCLHD